MADLARYWTPEFTEIYLDALGRDETFQRAARKVHETIALRCLDTPDGTDCYVEYVIDRGQVRVGDWQEQPAPSALRERPFDGKALLARTTAPYDFWTRLDRKEIGVIDVITSPVYRLEGSKLKVLRYLRMFNRMGEVASALPKRY